MRCTFFLFGLFLTLGLLQAADEKIQVQWTFVSSPKALFPEADPKQIFTAPGVQEETDQRPPTAPHLAGILTTEQTEITMKKAKADSATITPLKPILTSLGKLAEAKNLHSISTTGRLIGDLDLHSVGKVPAQPKGKRDIGYDLKCTPAGAVDGTTLDLELKIDLTQLTGYQDFLLSGGMADAVSRDPRETASDGFPRLRCPIISQTALSTNVTIWKGQTVLMQLTEGKKTGSYDYLMITATVAQANDKP